MGGGAATRLVLVRHGEVEERYQRVFGGRIDMGLSPLGLEQARRAAEYLEAGRFDAVYVSPMRRAQQTAGPIVEKLRLDATTLPELREVDFGAWTGHTWEEVKSKYGVSASDWLLELYHGRVAEAEPMAGYTSRLRRALDTIGNHAPGRTVCVVCHGGVIRTMLALLLELPVPKTAHFEIDYASVTVVDLGARRNELQLLNFTPWRRLP